MPALIWFGRRWRIASDDFPLPSVCASILLIFSWILSFIYSYPYDCGGNVFYHDKSPASNCEEVPSRIKMAILALLIIILVTVVCFLLTGLISLRGAIFEESKRRFVPVFLYIDTVCVAVMLVVVVICFKYIVYDKGLDPLKNHAKVIMLLSLSLDLLVCFAYIIFFAVMYDCSGRKTYTSFEDYEKEWVKRFSIIYCAFPRSQRKDPSFGMVAKILAQAFGACDVVPSDIAAGLLLLHGYQKCSRRIISQSLSYTPLEDGWVEKVCSEARLVLRLTPEQRDVVRELDHYMVYSQAILGWMFYEYSHFGYGLCSLWCSEPQSCCQRPSDIHSSVTCSFDLTALRRISGLLEEDIILTNWANEPFKPVYYVAHDPRTHAILIVVRGTMSLADCITDLLAIPEVLKLDDADDERYHEEDYYVHMGMLKSAQYILDSLMTKGILTMIESGPFADAKIRVIGHSLGAGVALLLSVLIWSSRRELRSRLRCLAYAPPGCTMSKAVMEYCKSYTVGCFLGYDLVPRIAPHTFESFRESLFDVMAASTIPKTLLFFNLWRTRKVAQSFHPSAQNHEPARNILLPECLACRKELRSSICAPVKDPRQLFPCATLVHLRKVVARSLPSCLKIGRCLPFARKEIVYIPCFEDPSEVQTIIASPSMFSDHMPDRLCDAISEVVCRMDTGELERFYVDELQSDVPEDIAPMIFVHPNSEELGCQLQV